MQKIWQQCARKLNPLAPPLERGEGGNIADTQASYHATFTPPLQRGAGGDSLQPQYQYLPLDTKYFPDLELDILALFDDLDAALDGWLVHSENYQALNTLMPKFRQTGKSYIYRSAIQHRWG